MLTQGQVTSRDWAARDAIERVKLSINTMAEFIAKFGELKRVWVACACLPQFANSEDHRLGIHHPLLCVVYLERTAQYQLALMGDKLTKIETALM